MLRQAGAGTKVSAICREHGISDATFHSWKKRYWSLGLSELRELRQLREETPKLKRLVADLSLDRHLLQDIVQKSCKAPATARSGALDPGGIRAQHAAIVRAGENHSNDREIAGSARPAAGATDAASRTGGDQSALGLSAADSVVETRRMAGQPQADLPHVIPRTV